jgi:hypothetical protein
MFTGRFTATTRRRAEFTPHLPCLSRTNGEDRPRRTLPEHAAPPALAPGPGIQPRPGPAPRHTHANTEMSRRGTETFAIFRRQRSTWARHHTRRPRYIPQTGERGEKAPQAGSATPVGTARPMPDMPSATLVQPLAARAPSPTPSYRDTAPTPECVGRSAFHERRCPPRIDIFNARAANDEGVATAKSRGWGNSSPAFVVAPPPTGGWRSPGWVAASDRPRPPRSARRLAQAAPTTARGATEWMSIRREATPRTIEGRAYRLGSNPRGP